MGLRKTVNLGWQGFQFSSYTPDKSQLLNYLASGTFREVFELNEVCLREMLCLLSSLARLLCC
ncbi:hypothetical protein VAE308_1150009 [Vibrio aestuarianus]|uniref:Uncharacterized protein n=1 Tax=Vibrio aestuarianus TaxID=28171 RepID=A0ABM9FHD0_9VIBR|nr:hypothetical protein VAE063_1000060 [Vibrio aestuarianus]CAH8214979.1 hypothetical protein VAE308_1150009 [Vibrio aestuarianus]